MVGVALTTLPFYALTALKLVKWDGYLFPSSWITAAKYTVAADMLGLLLLLMVTVRRSPVCEPRRR